METSHRGREVERDASPGWRGRDFQAVRWAAYVKRLHEGRVPPFGEQLDAYHASFAGRDADAGPPPAWLPGEDHLCRSNLALFMKAQGFESFDELHRWSVERRAEFWAATLERLGVVFTRKPEAILDLGDGPTRPRWLPGAELNCVDSCFTGPPDRVAIVSGGEGSDEIHTTTYGELEHLANRVANGLRELGLAPSEGVALYMPMTVECVAAYLGIIRAGCVVVSIADSLSACELAKRLDIAGARAVVTADRFVRAGREIDLYAKVVEAAAPRAIVIPSSPSPVVLRERDIWWRDFLGAEARFSLAGDPDETTNVLFSSGTTGTPKAIPWTHLTPVKCAADGHLHHDIRPSDTVCWPTNIGWMMGPWLVYASLINGASMALYEGSPSGAGFTSFVARAGVTILGVVPSLVRAWRASGACDHFDWTRIRVLSSTGEPSASEDYLWLMSRTLYRAPVIEYCGGTEIGGGYITGTVVQPASPATFTTPTLGLDLVVLDEGGSPVAEGEMGEVFLVPPSIGLSQALLRRDHDEVYYQGCPQRRDGVPLRRHGDQMQRLARGFYRARGRADDTMNLGGIKTSSRELEQVLEDHPAVFEAAAVGIRPDAEGPEKLVVFVVPDHERDPAELRRELGRMIAEHLNPLFRIYDLVVREHLPRTASGKLMRRALRNEYR